MSPKGTRASKRGARSAMSEAEVAEWRARWGSGPFVAVDLVIFTLRPSPARLSVLCIERGVPPFVGAWALPGGIVREGESLDAAARRELREETAVSDLGDAIVDQLASFGEPDRDPRARIVSVAYTALVAWSRVAHAVGGDDAASAAFFDVHDCALLDEHGAKLRLAFDHDEIVRAAIERLRARVTYTTAPFALMEEEFTLAELQAAYEAILGVPLHRRAFRERVEREGWAIATGAARLGAHRPARLFRAATRELRWMRPWPEASKITGSLRAGTE